MPLKGRVARPPTVGTSLPQHAMTYSVPHLSMLRPPLPHPLPLPLRPIQPYTSQIPYPIETGHLSSSSGWVSVNTNAQMKMAYPNGVDAPNDVADTSLGSPKRQKLAPIKPRMETNEPAYQPPLPRLESHESYPDSTALSAFIPRILSRQIQTLRPDSTSVLHFSQSSLVHLRSPLPHLPSS
jgi:hypothetical protein